MEATCPHCNNEISLVGAAELKDDYGLTPNAVQHARDKGRFPEPWLSFGNRNIWLKRTIEEHIASKRRSQVEANLTELMQALRDLPEIEREAALEQLARETKSRQA